MEEGKHYFRLGLFVVVTITILAAVLFLLGGRKLFQPTFTFETYFNESVAGLEIGAREELAEADGLGGLLEDGPLRHRHGYGLPVGGHVHLRAEDPDPCRRVERRARREGRS